MNVDPVGIVGGIFVIGLGLSLLLQDVGAIELTWGWLAAMALITGGATLFAYGIRR